MNRLIEYNILVLFLKEVEKQHKKYKLKTKDKIVDILSEVNEYYREIVEHNTLLSVDVIESILDRHNHFMNIQDLKLEFLHFLSVRQSKNEHTVKFNKHATDMNNLGWATHGL